MSHSSWPPSSRLEARTIERRRVPRTRARPRARPPGRLGKRLSTRRRRRSQPRRPPDAPRWRAPARAVAERRPHSYGSSGAGSPFRVSPSSSRPGWFAAAAATTSRRESSRRVGRGPWPASGSGRRDRSLRTHRWSPSTQPLLRIRTGGARIRLSAPPHAPRSRSRDGASSGEHGRDHALEILSVALEIEPSRRPLVRLLAET